MIPLQDTATLGQLFIELIALICTIILARQCNMQSKKDKNLSVCFAMVLLAVIAFHGDDWFHYADSVRQMRIDTMGDTNLEPIYYFIVQFIHQNYILFRIVVWGIAYILLWNTVKRLKIEISCFNFIFIICFLTTFNYARASLAMAVFFCGYSFLVKPTENKRHISILLGLLLMMSSLFFHKSAIFAICMAPFSLFIKINRKLVLIILCLFLLFFTTFISLINQEIFPRLFEANNSNLIDTETAYIYMAKEIESETRNFLGNVRYFLSYACYYLCALLHLVLVFKNKYMLLPSYIKRFYNLGLIILLASNIFLIDFGVNTFVFFYRTLYFSMIPFAISISYLYQNNIYRNFIRLIIIIGCINILFVFYPKIQVLL